MPFLVRVVWIKNAAGIIHSQDHCAACAQRKESLRVWPRYQAEVERSGVIFRNNLLYVTLTQKY